MPQHFAKAIIDRQRKNFFPTEYLPYLNRKFASRWIRIANQTWLVFISHTFQRAISVWLIPASDFNHYIIATVSGNKKIELLTYGWTNSPNPILALYHDHWYQYLLTTAFLGGISNQVYIKAEVFDLGFAGTAAPSLVNSSSGTINDSVLMADTAISVSITGAAYGGAVYLDDFHFEGREGYSDCINTPLGLDEETSSGIIIYPSPAMNSIFIKKNLQEPGAMNIRIFDLPGNKLADINSSQPEIEWNSSRLAKGIYIIQCSTNSRVWVKRFAIAR